VTTIYQIYSKYRNSRLVNYNRWSEATEVKELVEVLAAGVRSRKGSGYATNMRTLLIELYHSYLTDKEQYIAYFMAKNRYRFKLKLANGVTEDRYNKNPHITHDYFIGCIEQLISKRYIENKPGGHFSDNEGGSYGFLSRMKANESLVDLWREYKFNPDMITRFKPDEVIILRGREIEEYYYKGKKKTRVIKPDMPYLDDKNTTRMRKEVEAYNRLLERTHIDVDVDCMSQADKDAILDRLLHAKDKTKYNIDLSAKQVYRIFNNGSFKEGGRYYRAWWIGCPSIIRKYITINGEQTAELDYSGIHIHLLYALKGINFPALKTDAYELKLNDPDRDLNKLILLTAYNASSPEKTAKAVFKSTRDDGTKHLFKLKEHKQVTDKLELLKQKHPKIAEFIAKDKGSMLQYHDSQVLERLIHHYTAQKIPILTVHDSIICQSKYSDFVYEKMRELYTAYINEIFKSNLPYKAGYPQARSAFQHIRKQHSRYSIKPIPTYNPILAKILLYKGRIPVEDVPIIKVKSDITQVKCFQSCHHATRLKRVKAGKRTFLGKIKIQYNVIDQIAYLDIKQ